MLIFRRNQTTKNLRQTIPGLGLGLLPQPGSECSVKSTILLHFGEAGIVCIWSDRSDRFLPPQVSHTVINPAMKLSQCMVQIKMKAEFEDYCPAPCTYIFLAVLITYSATQVRDILWLNFKFSDEIWNDIYFLGRCQEDHFRASDLPFPPSSFGAPQWTFQGPQHKNLRALHALKTFMFFHLYW